MTVFCLYLHFVTASQLFWNQGCTPINTNIKARTSEVNNMDRLVTMQCSALKPVDADLTQITHLNTTADLRTLHHDSNMP